MAVYYYCVVCKDYVPRTRGMIRCRGCNNRFLEIDELVDIFETRRRIMEAQKESSPRISWTEVTLDDGNFREKCPICLRYFVLGETVSTPSCRKHLYHRNCYFDMAEKWKPLCAVCGCLLLQDLETGFSDEDFRPEKPHCHLYVIIFLYSFAASIILKDIFQAKLA